MNEQQQFTILKNEHNLIGMFIRQAADGFISDSDCVKSILTVLDNTDNMFE